MPVLFSQIIPGLRKVSFARLYDLAVQVTGSRQTIMTVITHCIDFRARPIGNHATGGIHHMIE